MGSPTSRGAPRKAEEKLVGNEANEETFKAAADAAMKHAKGYKYNDFKVELAKRSIVRALETVSGAQAA